MHNILIFKRPFTKPCSSGSHHALNNQTNVFYISDFKFDDDVGLIKRQHKHLSKQTIHNKICDIHYDAIISRDRYLRCQTTEQCIKLINAAWFALIDIWDQYNPKAFIGLPIDNYFLDLINLICTKRNIISMSSVNSAFPGLSRITSRGEYIKIRSPSQEEIQKQLQILRTKDYRPEWLPLSRTKFDIFKLYVRERIKKFIFMMMKKVKNDPFNFHYNTIYPTPEVITVGSYKNIFAADYFCSNQEVIEDKIKEYRYTVFFALQYTPETTLNYFVDDYQFSDYSRLIDAIIQVLPKDTLLLVKEHPAMLGYRNPQFYRRFLNQDNIVLVDINTPLSYLFEHSTCVLVTGSATTGIEALLKEKTVISLGGAYYGVNGWVHNIKNFHDVSTWPNYIPKRILLSENNLKHLVELLLSCTIEHNYHHISPKNNQLENAMKNQAAVKGFIYAKIFNLEQQS